MIYVTGDTHRARDIAKLRARSWTEGRALTRDDYVVVCGDFGAIWGERDLDDGGGALLRWWESRPWTTLFVDGNHENHDLIDRLRVEERFGTPVHVAPGCPHVIHLMRGCVYDLPLSGSGTARCLAMGGARSTDRMWRVEGESWWAREMPSDEEYDRCTASLEAVGWKVDYVLTHELPADLRIGALDWRSYAELANSADPLSNYLQWVYDTLDKDALRMWYAGHYHVDREVGDKCRVLFNDVVPLA
ncbi:MAG: metallophosphoesterase [Atopobiaceae bacterium]|nr:metallophosphoesterase [Atopobiaceae bacterium]